tara:strand:+ start:195 stop:485 length:291 start_codon:yes stop_codon:yes gene_type:complete
MDNGSGDSRVEKVVYIYDASYNAMRMGRLKFFESSLFWRNGAPGTPGKVCGMASVETITELVELGYKVVLDRHPDGESRVLQPGERAKYQPLVSAA